MVSPETRRAEAARPPVHRVGIAGLLLAAFAVILEVLAIAIGSGSAWAAATVIAWFVIGLQAVSFVLGLVAILSGRGRGRGRGSGRGRGGGLGWRFGLAAIVLSLLANPLLLVGLFSLMRDIS